MLGTVCFISLQFYIFITYSEIFLNRLCWKLEQTFITELAVYLLSKEELNTH